MKKTYLPFFLIVIICFMANFTQAQLKTPAPSPLCKITQAVGLTEVSIAYSRPNMKGRTIFGDLVPFDKVWRTGANRPTKIKFDDDVMVEGNKVAKGEYSLVTIPGKNEWSIILNKDSKGNGAFTYDAAEDVANFKVKSMTLANKVESFTISITDVSMSSLMVEISWEKTAVRFKIEQDVDTKVMAEIKKNLDPAKDANLYSDIAGYYLESNKNLSEALTLVNKSLDLNPNRFWTVHLKAKIQAKLNDKSGAIATAEKSKSMAMEAKNDDYVRLNEKLIAEMKK